jgi:hypothetical protein
VVSTMRDASIHRKKRDQPEYACVCTKNTCVGCGEKLNREEIEHGSYLCFECYLFAEG